MTAAIVDLGDAWPYPAITDAWRAGDATWFLVSKDRAMDALEAVPPRYIPGMSPASFMMGECAAHDARGVEVYTAFILMAGRYYARNLAVDQVADAVAALRATVS